MPQFIDSPLFYSYYVMITPRKEPIPHARKTRNRPLR
jgi:hypothetical protein